MRVEADEYIPVGPHVLVPNTTRFRGRDGVGVVASSTFMYTVADGRVTLLRLYESLRDAQAAVAA
jgi:hypothetical protein